MKATTICIVDDHQLFSRALANIVNSFTDFSVHSVIGSGSELVERIEYNIILPDIILLDIKMPGMNGIETMQWIHANRPELKVMALSMDNEEKTVLSMIKLGARGYILKDVHPKELNQALIDIRDKGFYHTELVNTAMLHSIAPQQSNNVPTLTDREKEFLQLATSDLTYKEIAAKMFLSPKTIDGYRESLFKKMKVKSRTGLVIQAIKLKLVNIG